MRHKLTFAGAIPEPRGLVIYVDVHVGGVRHPTKLKIPWLELGKADVVDHIDSAVRRRLIELWSERDVADPLF